MPRPLEEVVPALSLNAIADLTYNFWGDEDCMVSEKEIGFFRIQDTRLSLSAPRANTSSSFLSRLPWEILLCIMHYLDIRSLFLLRRVNWDFLCVVCSIPEYRFIATKMPDVVRALIRTTLVGRIALGTLYRILRTEKCVSCDDFAPFFHLLRLERVCMVCVDTKTKYLPMVEAEAKKAYGLTASVLKNLACLRAVPGVYSLCRLKRSRRYKLYDREAVIETARARNTTIIRRRQYRAAATTDEAMGAYRYMAVVRAPCYDMMTGNLEWGVTCRACHIQQRIRHNAEFRHTAEYGYVTYGIHYDVSYESSGSSESDVEEDQATSESGFVVNLTPEQHRLINLDWRSVYTPESYRSHIYDCPGTKEALNGGVCTSRRPFG